MRRQPRPAVTILLAQFRSPIVALLLAAALLALAFDEWLEATAIFAVLIINAAIGFVTEHRATRSMEALEALARVTTRVRRDGRIDEIDAADLVPGDIVLLEGGDTVSADMRLARASKLQADESTFTGESHAVDKHVESCADDAPLPERSSVVYSGTAIVRGSAEAIVTATGMQTELGGITRLVAEATKEVTPLEKRLNRLGQRLIGVTIAITLLVTATGIINGLGVLTMVQTGLALAVAAIPEGLPVVATLALARSVHLMASRHALIRQLSAVETLGATSVICCDKTGTLTENRMSVQRLFLADASFEVGSGSAKDVAEAKSASIDASPRLGRAADVMLLCNNAAIDPDDPDSRAIGDPIEVALLRAAVAMGADPDDASARLPEVAEVAFDPQSRMMATLHRPSGGGAYIAVKGAPEAVLAACTHVHTDAGTKRLDDNERKSWLSLNETTARGGLRLLALADGTAEKPTREPYHDLTLIGLVALHDPPRRDVGPALEDCRNAGINVVMMTGDQPATALGVAEAIGLAGRGEPVLLGSEIGATDEWSDATRKRLRSTRIFARVSPAQKLDLIELHQRAGEVVAMTGDGVNDAPALREADIGIAMGRRGTQVAREAADMVLSDDRFSTIVAAIAEGRTVFTNLRRFVVYLLSCNVSEVMVVGFASILGLPIPVTPLQILFLNLVTDVFPALALGVGPSRAAQMQAPPRPASESIVPAPLWIAISAYGVAITVSVLVVTFGARTWFGLDDRAVVTASFLTLLLAQLWHVLNMRDVDEGRFRNTITGNRYVWAALALCLVIVGVAFALPASRLALELVWLDAPTLGLVIALSLAPLIVGQLVLEGLRHRRGEAANAKPTADPAASPPRPD